MKSAVFAVVAALTVSACGGSGSSSSGTALPAVTDFSALKISSGNASELYADSTQAVTGDSVSTPTIPSDALTYAVPTSVRSFDEITQLYSTFTVSTRALVALQDNAQCQSGGTLSVSGSSSFENPGDSITVFFNQCVASGVTLSGGFTMSMLSGTSIQTNIRIDFNNFRSIDATRSVTIHGDLTARSTQGSSQYAAIESSLLNIRDSVSGDTVLSNMSVTGLLNSGGDSQLAISYTIGSDALSGRLTITTPTVLLIANGENWPHMGVLHIAGDTGHYVTLDANTGDTNTVLMTVSDGASTQSNTVAWSSLNGNHFNSFVDYD